MRADAPWRRSRRSGSTGGQCVEVSACGDGLVRVRDSKDPGGLCLVVAAADWLAWLAGLKTPGAGPPPGCLTVSWDEPWLLLRGQPAGPALRYTRGEWRVFRLGVRDGEFDLTGDGHLVPPP